jgi:hypothetical protein
MTQIEILLARKVALAKKIAALKNQEIRSQRKADMLLKIYLGAQVLEFLNTNQSATSKAYFIKGALANARNDLAREKLERMLASVLEAAKNAALLS